MTILEVSSNSPCRDTGQWDEEKIRMFDLTGNTSVDTGLSGYKQHVCFGAKIRSVEKRNGCRW